MHFFFNSSATTQNYTCKQHVDSASQTDATAASLVCEQNSPYHDWFNSYTEMTLTVSFSLQPRQASVTSNRSWASLSSLTHHTSLLALNQREFTHNSPPTTPVTSWKHKQKLLSLVSHCLIVIHLTLCRANHLWAQAGTDDGSRPTLHCCLPQLSLTQTLTKPHRIRTQ